MARSLADKVIAVTGGARGIGAATAAALTRAGATVAIGDIDPEAANAGDHALALPVDVTDRDALTSFLDTVERRLGPIDVLINNAGIMPLTRIEDEQDTATARILAINLHAVIHGSREAARRMRPRGGHIVNVASVAARIPFPGGATYAATKFGVLGFSEAIRAELRESDVDVSCVLPGFVRTELAAGLPEVPGFAPITPDDVAAAIVATLRRPRFEVYVPRRIGPMLRLSTLTGRRFSEWLQRMLRAETPMLSAVGSPERAAYEERTRSPRKGAR
ncbi:SDR family oxidoreductase [Haloechinothrix halophila]|uniref:SDR family oxidoreductase n=1 Tax=Haloechinothrix halophila TaxID=1069073 RepID=UPI00041D1FD2|nr:SDR family oxidoreductase [Haloechinothrix halophila]